MYRRYGVEVRRRAFPALLIRSAAEVPRGRLLRPARILLVVGPLVACTDLCVASVSPYVEVSVTSGSGGGFPVPSPAEATIPSGAATPVPSITLRPTEVVFSNTSWAGYAAVLVIFAGSAALLMGRNLSTGPRVLAASAVAISGMFVGEHLLSFESVVKLDKLIDKFEPKLEFHAGEDSQALNEINAKLEELEDLVKTIKHPSVMSANLRPLGSIENFPEGSHTLLSDRTTSGVHPAVMHFDNAELLRAQCLVVVGGADMRPLRRKVAERYGSNWALARARATWVANQLSELARTNRSGPALPVIVLTQRPEHENAGNDPELLSRDRRVDVYACIASPDLPTQ